MNQFLKDKMQKEIMVVKNSQLFKNTQRRNGFYKNEEFNFEKVVLCNYEYMVRHIAEENFDYKQPISYGIIVNEQDNIFVYKRWWKGSSVWESRLHSKISFWIWWHLERDDELWNNPIKKGLIREVKEELNISKQDIKSLEAIWYINEDDWAVSEVHFWMAYFIRVHNSNFELLDWELENWEFVSLKGLENILNSVDYDVENWSRIFFEPLKDYLNKYKNSSL